MSGLHAGQCSDPGTLTGSQREMITGWVIALGRPAAIVMANVTGAACVDDLSEKQAGDLLEALYARSISR